MAKGKGRGGPPGMGRTMGSGGGMAAQIQKLQEEMMRV